MIAAIQDSSLPLSNPTLDKLKIGHCFLLSTSFHFDYLIINTLTLIALNANHLVIKASRKDIVKSAIAIKCYMWFTVVFFVVFAFVFFQR